jgi:hypothetical protein
MCKMTHVWITERADRQRSGAPFRERMLRRKLSKKGQSGDHQSWSHGTERRWRAATNELRSLISQCAIWVSNAQFPTSASALQSGAWRRAGARPFSAGSYTDAAFSGRGFRCPHKKGADASPLGPSPGRKRPKWAAIAEADLERPQSVYDLVRGREQATLCGLVNIAPRYVAFGLQSLGGGSHSAVTGPNDGPLKSGADAGSARLALTIQGHQP